MQRNHPEFLSLRKMKRSYSAATPHTGSEQQDLVIVDTKDQFQKPFHPFHNNDSGLPYHSTYSRNEGVFLQEDAEYQGQKNQSKHRLWRCLSVFLFVLATLAIATCVALCYFVSNNVRNNGHHSENNEMFPQTKNPERLTAQLLKAEEPSPQQVLNRAQGKPEIEMVFDKSCSIDNNNDSDILKWKHAPGVIGFKERLEYDQGYFILPLAGRYDVHVTLGVNVAYLRDLDANKTLGIYVCVSKKMDDEIIPLRCSNSRLPRFWAGQISVDIFRMSFDKNDVLLTTLSTDYKDRAKVKEIIRTEPEDSHLQMFYL